MYPPYFQDCVYNVFSERQKTVGLAGDRRARASVAGVRLGGTCENTVV